MSPSESAELLRRIKNQIDEVDPSEVNELIGEGVTIVDVRGSEEFATGHLPGAKSIPRGLPRGAHRERRARPLGRADPLLRLGQPLGLRRAHPAGGPRL